MFSSCRSLNFSYFVKNLRFNSKSRLEHFPKQKTLESSKLKEFADINFKFDERGEKFSKWVEKTVAKGEIAHYEQFLLFPWCFQKTFTADKQKQRHVWKWVKRP